MKQRNLILTLVMFAITLNGFAQTPVSQTTVTLPASGYTMVYSQTLMDLNMFFNGAQYSGYLPATIKLASTNGEHAARHTFYNINAAKEITITATNQVKLKHQSSAKGKLLSFENCSNIKTDTLKITIPDDFTNTTKLIKMK